MQVSKEFLMEAFGLTLMVALILISVRLFQRAEEVVLFMEKNQKQTLNELEEYELTKYDGLIVDGITAVGYIKSIINNYCIPVTVTTKKGVFSVQEVSEYQQLRRTSSECYINPMGLYFCEVIRDENGAVETIGITIEEE